MQDFLLNPILSILLGQLILIWSLVIAHWGSERIAKRVTLILAIPITIFSVLVLYTAATDAETKNERTRSTVADINANTTKLSAGIKDLEDRARTSAESLDAVFSRIESINKDLAAKLPSLLQQTAEISKVSSDITAKIDETTAGLNRSVGQAQAAADSATKAIRENAERQERLMKCAELRRQNPSTVFDSQHPECF